MVKKLYLNNINDEGKNYSTKKTIIKKLIIISTVISIFLISVLVIKIYFYVFNSYYYTAEFHLNFLNNHIKDADKILLTDYFKSLKTITNTFPLLSLAYIIQNTYLFKSKPVLFSALKDAFGPLKGFTLCYSAIFVVTIFSIIISYFLFGDISKIIFRKSFFKSLENHYKYTFYAVISIMLIVPTVSVYIPTIISSIININIKKLIFIICLSLFIRLFLEMSYNQI
jgi:hypothetical protein